MIFKHLTGTVIGSRDKSSILSYTDMTDDVVRGDDNVTSIDYPVSFDYQEITGDELHIGADDVISINYHKKYSYIFVEEDGVQTAFSKEIKSTLANPWTGEELSSGGGLGAVPRDFLLEWNWTRGEQ